MRARDSFYHKWLNNTLDLSDILMLRIRVPNDISFIRSIPQRVYDLLNDNDCNRVVSSHLNYDDRLKITIFQKWAGIPQLIERSHVERPPELQELAVVTNLKRAGLIDARKNNIMLAIAGIISLDALDSLGH